MCWMVSHYGRLWMEWLQQSDCLNYPCNWQLTMARQNASLGDALTWLLCRLWPRAKSQRAGGQNWANGEPYFVYISGYSGVFPPIHFSFSTNSEAVPVPRRKVVKLVQLKLQPPILPPKPWKVLWQCIPMILHCFHFCRIRYFFFELQFINTLLSSALPPPFRRRTVGYWIILN